MDNIHIVKKASSSSPSVPWFDILKNLDKVEEII